MACWRAYLAYFVRAIQLSDAIAVDSQSTRSARCTEGSGEWEGWGEEWSLEGGGKLKMRESALRYRQRCERRVEK